MHLDSDDSAIAATPEGRHGSFADDSSVTRQIVELITEFDVLGFHF
jgi:hypothetical protein